MLAKTLFLLLLFSSLVFAEVSGDTVPLTDNNQNTLIAETVAPEHVVQETPPFPPAATPANVINDNSTAIGFICFVAVLIILYYMWKMIRHHGKRGKPRQLNVVKTVRVREA